MQKMVKWPAGLLKDTTGRLATSPEETIDILCKAHFPDAKPLQQREINEYIQNSSRTIGKKEVKEFTWIREDIITKAINSFKNNKAPGLDGITPNMLKLSSNNAVKALKLLFEMQISLGYTPTVLRTSKVAFIGKAEKDDYSLPKSFRPISLTPFIFKLLERVGSWYIIHKSLKDNPLNYRQHAYRTGKSTESAISQVLNQVEKGLLRRSFTLACFIDISSAFDRLDPKKAIRALIEKGIPKSIALWYENYLTMRFLDITIKGITIRKWTAVGCPQGGVLSTILWNVAFDNLLNLFNNEKVICVGYADDGSLLLSHDNLPYLFLKLNDALAKCQEWATAFGLDISPEKTKYMLFTKKTKYRIPIAGLKLKGKAIERVESFKYLGLHFHERLSWTTHVKTRLASATKMLHKLKSYIGKTWGPSPKMTLYAYTSSIRPMIAYGSFAFANHLTNHMVNKLRSFQRKLLMSLGPFRDNTPGDSLEVIFDVMPLDLFIQGEGRKANYRLKGNFDQDWTGQGTGKRLGHVKQASFDELEMGLPQGTCDKIDTIPIWDKRYTINIGNGDNKYQGYQCYTDGSRTKYGTGSGVCLMIHTHVLKTRCFGLTEHANVFQAELHAIKQATHLIKSTQENFANDDDFKTVRILSDSQAALMSLNKIDTDSRLVAEVKHALNELGSHLKVELAWVKAHVNHKGNEIADRLAKTGTKLATKTHIGPGRSTINNHITQYMYGKWNERWINTPGHRQTKLFLPTTLNRGLGKKARELSRTDTGILVRHITGHAFLRRHNDIIDKGYVATYSNEVNQTFLNHINSDNTLHPDEFAEVDINSENYATACRLCKQHGSVETPFHLLECNALWRERRDHFRTYSQIQAPFTNWKPQQLVDFFKDVNLEN